MANGIADQADFSFVHFTDSPIMAGGLYPCPSRKSKSVQFDIYLITLVQFLTG